MSHEIDSKAANKETGVCGFRLKFAEICSTAEVNWDWKIADRRYVCELKRRVNSYYNNRMCYGEKWIEAVINVKCLPVLWGQADQSRF